PFYNNERSRLGLRQLLHREHYFFHHLTPLEIAAEREPLAAAELRQNTPQVGLEHDDDGKRRIRPQDFQKCAHQVEMSPDGNQIHQSNDTDARQDVCSPAPSNDQNDLVDQRRHQQNVDDGCHREGGERDRHAALESALYRELESNVFDSLPNHFNVL